MQLERDNRFKHIIYIDLDNVLADCRSSLDNAVQEVKIQHMKPMPGAIEAVKTLAAHRRYDLYILTTAPWDNPSVWADKLEWVKKHLDSDRPDGVFYKKLILTHHKNLCIQRRAWLISDGKAHGSEHFDHHLIQFGSEEFPDWDSIVNFFVGGAPYPVMRETRNQIWGTRFLSSLNGNYDKSE